MSLAEKARNAKPRTATRVRCDVQKALDTLDQEDGDALLYLVYDRRDLTGVEVADLLDEEGVHVGPDTVRRHRLARCRACKSKE